MIIVLCGRTAEQYPKSAKFSKTVAFLRPIHLAERKISNLKKLLQIIEKAWRDIGECIKITEVLKEVLGEEFSSIAS